MYTEKRERESLVSNADSELYNVICTCLEGTENSSSQERKKREEGRKTEEWRKGMEREARTRIGTLIGCPHCRRRISLLGHSTGPLTCNFLNISFS